MHVVVLFCVAALAPVDTPRDEDVKKELARLQGVWKITSREVRGRALPNPTPDRYTLVIAGEQCQFYVYGGTVKLEPSRRPPTLDLFITDGRYQGRTLPGIYELSGNTLKLALPTSAQRAEQRPAGFTTADATDFTIFTFARDLRATKDTVATELKQRRAKMTTPPPAANTAELLQRVLERLDRIDQRLDALEKKTGEPGP